MTPASFSLGLQPPRTERQEMSPEVVQQIRDELGCVMRVPGAVLLIGVAASVGAQEKSKLPQITSWP